MLRFPRLAPVAVTVLLTATVFFSAAGPASAAPALIAGWQSQVVVDPTSNSLASYLELSVNKTGAAIALWFEWDTGLGYPWVNSYTPERGWGNPVKLSENGSSSIYAPSVSFGDDGIGFATWVEGDTPVLSAFAATMSPGGAWTAPSLLVGPKDISFVSAQATHDGGGFAFWTLSDGAAAPAWGSRFDTGPGWQTPAIVGPAADGNGSVVLGSGSSSNGTVFVMLSEGNASDVNLSARIYYPGAGWQAEVPLEGNASWYPTMQAIGVARNGNAMAIWGEYDGDLLFNVASRSFSPQSGWGPRELIPQAMFPTEMSVGVDTAGTASAVWTYFEGVYSVQGSRHVPGAGWANATELDPSDYSSAGRPHVAVADGGAMMAVWSQDYASGDQLAYAFVKDDGNWSLAAPIMGSYPHVNLAFGISASGTPMVAYTDGHDTFSITYLAREFVPPHLAVWTPGQGATLNRSTVRITGATEPGATVFAGGAAADVAPDGSFTALAALVPGANTIRVTAEDAWGNMAYQNITVTFDDPVADLEAALAEALNNASSAAAAAATAQALAAAAQAAADDSSANVTALQLQLIAARADLASANANATLLQARVATLENQPASNSTAVDEANRRANEAQIAANNSGSSAAMAMAVAIAALVVGVVGMVVGMRKKPPVAPSENAPK